MRLLSTVALAALVTAAHPLSAQQAADAPADVPPATADQGATGAPDAAAAQAQPDPAAAPAAATTPVPRDTVVATVNGTEITVGHMLAAKSRLPEQYLQLPDPVLFTALIDQLVQQEAVAGTAGELAPDARYVLENERRSLAASQAAGDQLRAAITEASIRARYDEVVAGGEPQPEWNASHILVASEAEAQAVKVEIEGGADFAELARTRSTDPTAAAGGGSLGWFGAGQMVPEFEAAVKTLAAGEVSAPVQTQFGWHIVRLDETRVAAPPAFEEVAGQIAQQLQQEEVARIFTEAVAAATVEKTDVSAIPPQILSDPALVAE